MWTSQRIVNVFGREHVSNAGKKARQYAGESSDQRDRIQPIADRVCGTPAGFSRARFWSR